MARFKFVIKQDNSIKGAITWADKEIILESYEIEAIVMAAFDIATDYSNAANVFVFENKGFKSVRFVNENTYQKIDKVEFENICRENLILKEKLKKIMDVIG